MKRLLASVGLILLAGCGSGGNAAAVTPVMASTIGSYRLIASTVSSTAGNQSGSGGTLRLFATDYQRTAGAGGQDDSAGSYQLGNSVNNILNSRHGSFSLTSTEPAVTVTGSYQLTPDFTLTLDYDQYSLPGQGLVTRSETWLKVSDYPQSGS